MQNILQELWYGNIGSNENRKISKREQKTMQRVADSYDALETLLTDSQMKAFGEFEDVYSELRNIGEEETFMYAFKLGVRMAIEVMSLDINHD